jgi:SAM-dependent methyltransferase
MSNNTCPVCHSHLCAGYQKWHFVCKRCSYEKADLQPAINLQSAHEPIDEDARETGLRELRTSNFKELLATIKRFKPSGGRLLDVGCAHGWFLDIAGNDFEVLGLEPDRKISEATLQRGLPVRTGYFPDALADSEKFDVLVFNDVIEHIDNIRLTLESCYDRLNENGLLVLNLPSSSGFIYKVSKMFCRFGYTGFFDRMWQKDFPSPHVHYFNLCNLLVFLVHNGFSIETKGTLSSLRLAGLYNRVSHTYNRTRIANMCIYISAALLLPLLKICPGDIIYVVSKRK